jgi:DNA-binding winged helix-turn-helix (wHTH) protein
LLRSPGQIVTREELRQTLWGTDTFVDFDRSLNKAINRLREALEDSAENPRFIEAIPKRGYRFIAPVEPTQAAAMSSAATNTNVVVEPQKKKLHASRREALARGLALLFLSAAISIWLLHSSPAQDPILLRRTRQLVRTSLWLPEFFHPRQLSQHASCRLPDDGRAVSEQPSQVSQPAPLCRSVV